ncbi:MAG: response regulator [Candidatus Omnitrophica bacterium]|nr:response regulator [Candidatus Omnitrophota bacterium]
MRNLTNKKFYTTGDIAEIFGVSRISAYKWIKNGKIKAFKVPGGRYRVTTQGLKEFIKKSGLEEKIPYPDRNIIKILIVDDEKLIAQSIKDFLESKHPSWHINLAHDGFEAGRLITIVNPDIIILDLFLPGVNGFYLCRNLKNNEATKNIKIIAITGYPTEENIEKIKEYGADAVLSKPFNMDELEKILNKLL